MRIDDFAEFEGQVEEALTRLYDPTYHPPELLWLHLGFRAAPPNDLIRERLTQAIEQLQPPDDVPASARVRLVEADPRVLGSFPEALSRKAEAQLHKLGVEVLTGAPVAAIDREGVQIGKRYIRARTVLWAAGVAASPLARTLGVPLDKAGRVIVGGDLRVPAHPRIFVAGDLAALEQDGKPVPGLAPAAKQMGIYAGRAIKAELKGMRIGPFRYRHAGSLATIGRKAAVADLGRFKLSGLPAWWFWLLVHIYFLIGFRNRLMVLADWAWSYWTYQRSARIIFELPDDTRPFE